MQNFSSSTKYSSLTSTGLYKSVVQWPKPCVRLDIRRKIIPFKQYWEIISMIDFKRLFSSHFLFSFKKKIAPKFHFNAPGISNICKPSANPSFGPDSLVRFNEYFMQLARNNGPTIRFKFINSYEVWSDLYFVCASVCRLLQ